MVDHQGSIDFRCGRDRGAALQLSEAKSKRLRSEIIGGSLVALPANIIFLRHCQGNRPST